MKKGITIIIIMLAMIGGSIWEYVYIKNNLNLLQEKAENLINVVGTKEDVSNDDVYNLVIDLENFWDKIEPKFCVFINHLDIEEVGELIVDLKTFSLQNKKEEFVETQNKLLFYSQSYEHILLPNFENIL